MAAGWRFAADPAAQFKDVSTGSVANDASQIRADLVGAITKAIQLGYLGVQVFPTMSAGASDSMWFRNEHIPSYGVSPLFIRDSDRFAHGRNEPHSSQRYPAFRSVYVVDLQGSVEVTSPHEVRPGGNPVRLSGTDGLVIHRVYMRSSNI